ncbi:MAG: hypothetical protein ABII90_14270 [Bacteroidota bacterium]
MKVSFAQQNVGDLVTDNVKKTIIIRDKATDITVEDEYRTINFFLGGFRDKNEIDDFVEAVKDKLFTCSTASPTLGVLLFDVEASNSQGQRPAKLIVKKEVNNMELIELAQDYGIEFIEIEGKLKPISTVLEEGVF